MKECLKKENDLTVTSDCLSGSMESRTRTSLLAVQTGTMYSVFDLKSIYTSTFCILLLFSFTVDLEELGEFVCGLLFQLSLIFGNCGTEVALVIIHVRLLSGEPIS